MSYYYKYRFTSPEPLYARVKEEFKSYFDSGAVDDLLFPIYVRDCLKRLGNSSYNIYETLLHIDDFSARLPDNFYAVREAWLCTSVDGFSYRTPSSFYSQAMTQETIQVSPVISGDKPCHNDDCSCESCMPLMIQAVYKTNNEVLVRYKKTILLSPGNISVLDNCGLDCVNVGSSSFESFDIRDNKFVTNFREGVVYLIYYGEDFDKEGSPMVPDNFFIKDYIVAYLKYKVIETLINNTHDETFNQLERKLVYYKQQADEAFVIAETEIKKQDIHSKKRAIKRNRKRFRHFEL